MERKRSGSAKLKEPKKCAQCGPHLHQAVFVTTRNPNLDPTMRKSVYRETRAGQIYSCCRKFPAPGPTNRAFAAIDSTSFGGRQLRRRHLPFPQGVLLGLGQG